MKTNLASTAALAVFLCLAAPAQAQNKHPFPDRSRPPERQIIGPIIPEFDPLIGIPPCLVDEKQPCEVLIGTPAQASLPTVSKSTRKKGGYHARNR